MLGGGVLLLAVSWLAATADTVSGLEEDLFRLFNDLPDWLERPIWPVMQLGAIGIVPLVAAVAWFATKRWRLGAGIAVSAFVGWLLAKVVKEMVERGRPQEFLADVNFRPEWDGLGFVSGHAAVAFAMAAILSPYLRRPWKVLAWVLAVATGLLRMYTAAHLPLDITGGAGLGIAVAALWQLATVHRHPPIEAEASTRRR
jgi:undecaprenyl-diphosphatase